MRQAIYFLNQVVLWIRFAQTTLQGIDVNTTGWDDDFARFLAKIEKEIVTFIETHPVPADTVVRGYAATLAFCNTILQSLGILIESNLPKAEKVAKAEALIADLSDPSKVYQAKKGDDANVLRDTKAKAQQRLETILNS